jgi:REP-associated tyrosine transposase
MSVALRSPGLWQPGFFDHILRSGESYAEKWNYVRENPVRAGVVKNADDWPYQGKNVLLESRDCRGRRVACWISL